MMKKKECPGNFLEIKYVLVKQWRWENFEKIKKKIYVQVSGDKQKTLSHEEKVKKMSIINL